MFILAVLALLYLNSHGLIDFGLFATLGDPESQLKEEYTPYWSDYTDGIPDFSVCTGYSCSSNCYNQQGCGGTYQDYTIARGVVESGNVITPAPYCQSNTCGGTQSGTDQYSCPLWTVNVGRSSCGFSIPGNCCLSGCASYSSPSVSPHTDLGTTCGSWDGGRCGGCDWTRSGIPSGSGDFSADCLQQCGGQVQPKQFVNTACVSWGNSCPSGTGGSSQIYYKDNKWILEGRTGGDSIYGVYSAGFSIGSTSTSLSVSTKAQSSHSITTFRKFQGQEVAVLASGQIGENNGGCSISPGGIQLGQYKVSETKIIKYVPHTFDTSLYDVVVNGIKIAEINIGSGLRISLQCGGGTREAGGWGNIDFIGYKAQYECDVGENEVWVQEQFSEPFDINDLEYVPTKFCHTPRQFLLRNITGGETAIRREEGIYPFNRGETLPPRPFKENEFIVVNYATVYVPGVINKCGPNEVNVKDEKGKWICKGVIFAPADLLKEIEI